MGIVCKRIINPAGAITGFAMWIFIYGLMGYLPIYCIPTERGARKPHWYKHLLVILAVFLIAIPLLIPIVYLLVNVLQHPTRQHF